MKTFFSYIITKCFAQVYKRVNFLRKEVLLKSDIRKFYKLYKFY